MSEPSVLTYARYFDLTRDYTLYDPLTALDDVSTQPDDPTILQTPDESVETLVKRFEETARDYVSLANDDLSPISQDVADYLKSCTSQAVQDIRQTYDEMLPDPYRIRKLKLDLPLLMLGGGDVERDVRKIRRGIDLQIVIEDFLDDEGEKRNNSQNYEPPTSSTMLAEILEWSRIQLEAATKKVKLDVSMNTMKYIRETLSVSSKPLDMSRMLRDSLPEITTRGRFESCSITEDDFQFENETDPCEPDEIGEEELPRPAQQELGTSGRPNAAVDEEYFLQSTQADREMDELFRQFTHHDIDDQGKVVVNEVQEGTVEEFRVVKRRKLIHEINSETIPQDLGGNDIRDLKIGLEDLKIKTSNIFGSICFGLPALDLSVMYSQDKSKNPGRKVSDPGPPPFRIPTIHEALRESMPIPTKVADKFSLEAKPIISSDMLLWKEPGLRVLDHDDAEDNHFVPDDYQIEEWRSDTFMSIQPETMDQRASAYFFDKVAHGDDADDISHDPKKHAVKTNPTIIKSEPGESVRVKQEHRPINLQKSVIGSTAVSVNPLARPEARILSELNTVSGGTVSSEVSGSSSKAQISTGPPKLSDEPTDRETTIAKYDVEMKSLLPEAKRQQAAQQIKIKKESILDDPLSSFLDLRGKQFKLPAVKEIRKTTEVTDDPIISTQDSFAEGWFSDEQTVVLSPTQPAKPVTLEVIPLITPLEEPRTIIVNTTLLRTKPLLIQFLENPDTTNLTLIYRDIDVGEYYGPDLVLNTTTCLFITNLQSLNQRPLPGQNSTTGLSSAHDRIANLTRSYFQVIVLVHYSTSTDGVTQLKTVSTQASFAAFCQNFARNSLADGKIVQPYWLSCLNPTSTSNIVNAWVWQVIHRCAYRNGNPKSPRPSYLAHPTLIQEETLWELFLCKAGLNPLAAQVVISSLKRSSVQGRTGADQEALWGLRRLVAMDSQERTRMFGELIGVEVVERLNEVLSHRAEFEHRK